MKDPRQIQGWMTDRELAWLTAQATTHNSIIEIGIWKGRSTSAICQGLINNQAAKLIAIDNWNGSIIDPINYQELEKFRWRVIQEAKTNLKPFLDLRALKILELNSNDAFQLLKVIGLSADMIFIDGDHEESQVRADIENYRQLLSAGGLMSGHDYQLPQIQRAVKDILGGIDGTIDSIWFKYI